MVLLSMVPITFLLSRAPKTPEDRASLLASPEIFYISLTTGLLLAALVLGRLSVRRWSHLEMRDNKNQERLHDEHERAIRYRAGSRALSSVLFLQGLLYAWATFESGFGLPGLPPGMPQVATLLVGHLVFWIPYLQKTK